MSGIIFHIDVNSAFLSWSAIKLLEEGSQIDLRLVPSIVGGDQKTRHGVVVAKSIPAKKFGIHTADTVASAFNKCPTLVSVPPDHAYYSEKSRALMDFLRGICPRIQKVSVDECYMDFEPIRGRFDSPEMAARYICDSVQETFGFTVNVGISDRKVLAKMASDFEKPNRVHTLYVSEIQEKLWPLPVETLHMCGKSSANALRQMGIQTIGDLARFDRERISYRLKSHGRLLWEYANGIDGRTVDPEPREVKSVGNSTTLADDLRTRDSALPVLLKLSGSVSARLEKQQMSAGQVTVEIKYATFRQVSHQMMLERPASDQKTLYTAACRLFDELWDGEPIRLLGVRTGDLRTAGEPEQMTIFQYQAEKTAEEEDLRQKAAEEEKRQKLEAALGKIEKKYGTGAIRKGYGKSEDQ